ncbi:hypothetical protein LSAT2_025887 [Lamellibrachia satsuma]|nr:hypothetical protein LSAT2_025887 [Lamellibrachia satsuma]
MISIIGRGDITNDLLVSLSQAADQPTTPRRQTGDRDFHASSSLPENRVCRQRSIVQSVASSLACYTPAVLAVVRSVRHRSAWTQSNASHSPTVKVGELTTRRHCPAKVEVDSGRRVVRARATEWLERGPRSG